MAQSIQK